jgi:hypothetical protein
MAKYMVRLTKVQREIKGKQGDERVCGDEETQCTSTDCGHKPSPDRPGPTSVQMLGEHLQCACAHSLQ